MRITRSKARVISELTIDQDIPMLGYSLTGLGAPASTNDSLRYGVAEIRNQEIKTDADIVYSKLYLTGKLLMADLATAIKNAANGLVVLDALADVPLAQIPDTLTGKDADTLDTYEAADLLPDYPMKLKPNLTRWVLPGYANQVAISTFTVTANLIYYIPIFVEETTTYIRIGLYVSTESAGNADLRIFAWDDGVPGALILSAGTVDTGSTGAKEITIAQELTRGYYFLAVRFTGTPIVKALDQDATSAVPVSGVGDVLDLILDGLILTVSAAYADPAPAPTATGAKTKICLTLREN